MNLEPVRRVLDGLGTRYALIGAHAMAVRGYPRFTLDVDLLTTDRRVLDAGHWDLTAIPTRTFRVPGSPFRVRVQVRGSCSGFGVRWRSAGPPKGGASREIGRANAAERFLTGTVLA